MYLYQKMNGTAAFEFCEARSDKFAKDFNLSAVARVEIYSASTHEDGEDFCEIRVFDSKDEVLAWTRWSDF